MLSGEGPSFCAGLDFGSFQQMAGGDAAATATDRPATRRRWSPGRITHLGQQVAWVWQEVPVPVIAAVHGHALGGGIQIALGADIRIVHPDAQLSVREVHWGLVPDMTGTLILSRLVRPDVAKELTFTGRMVVGRRGRSPSGLATRLSETPLEDALALARRDRRPAAPRRCGARRPCSTALLADGRGGAVRRGAPGHRRPDRHARTRSRRSPRTSSAGRRSSPTPP